MKLQTQTSELVMSTRPYVDLESSLLNTIRRSLQGLTREKMVGINPITEEIIRSAWKAEILAIGNELIQRN